MNNNDKIEKLHNKLEELYELTKEQSIDFSFEISELEKKLTTLKENYYSHLTPWDKVSLVRMSTRPVAKTYIDHILDDFIELHGDRLHKDDKAVIGGIGFLDKIPVTVIGQQKGATTKENIERNFGMLHPEGYRKALRLMKQAEKFHRPIICFVDTPGAFCGIGAEERGQGEAIARNLMEMSMLKVPIISVVIGEGGSGGALAIAAGDRVWMLEHSVYSILTPEGFASILWKDSSKAKEAAEVMKMTAKDLLDLGAIEKVIPEPLGGANAQPVEMADTIKALLIEEIKELLNLDVDVLLENRFNRFRQMGSSMYSS